MLVYHSNGIAIEAVDASDFYVIFLCSNFLLSNDLLATSEIHVIHDLHRPDRCLNRFDSGGAISVSHVTYRTTNPVYAVSHSWNFVHLAQRSLYTPILVLYLLQHLHEHAFGVQTLFSKIEHLVKFVRALLAHNFR